MNTTYKLDVVEGDDGDQLLQLSEEFCIDQDWREGDVISWDTKDGSVIATNKCAEERKNNSNKKLVLVETVSIFRHRYVVECNEEEHAADEVVCNLGKDDFEEFSQHHVDESISSTRVITEQEYLVLFNKDNHYLAAWDIEQKKRFINKIDYSE